MPYVALQRFLDGALAPGSFAHERGSYVADLDDGVVEVLTEHVARRRSPLSTVVLMPLDRAYCAVPDDATAFGGARTPRWMVSVVGLARTRDELGPERDRTRALWSALQPFERGGASVNGGVGPDEHRRIRAVYGAKYARLSAVKAQYDPHNVFHGNANIPPGE